MSKKLSNMPSLESFEEKSSKIPSFVMNLDGVEFRLEPESSFGANINFQPAFDDNSISLHLSNFTGSLKVIPSITTTHSKSIPRVSISPEVPVRVVIFFLRTINPSNPQFLLIIT